MFATSVKAPQLRADAHLLPQDPREPAALGGAVEAREDPTCVDPAAGLCSARDEHALASGEAQ